MAEDEFTIDKSKLAIVRGQIQIIRDIFGVQVEVLSRPTTASVVSDHRVNENGGTKVSIRLHAPIEKEYFMAKAKTFILSLPQDETEKLSPQHDYQSSIEQELLKICDDVTPNGSSGVPDAMEQSRSDLPNKSGGVEDEVREEVKRLPVQLGSSSEGVMLNMEMMQPSAGQDESCSKHGVLQPTLSPGAESHDSCYDSDTSSLGSRRNSTTRLGTGYHSDVSRTVSDTLAAEHTKEVEDVRCLHIVQKSEEFEGHQDDISVDQPVFTISEYLAKVEFAIKLGYTEEQVKLVLQKLGSAVTSNELLCELIKLGSVDRGSEGWQEEDEAKEPVPEDSQQNIVEDVPEEVGYTEPGSNLRPIVIDGSNVAMSHGNKEVYSSHGIKLAVDWFRLRGHKEITVFVPQWRKEAPRPENPIADQNILYELEKEKVLVFTPARRVGGKRVVCYDDRYIIRLAAENGGVVVSNDNYRDLINESPEFKKVIEERLLMYSFVNDRFMPPDDPLGRHGPNLDTFLSKESPVSKTLQTICPYAKKCTYGNKCKYYHPERGSKPHRSVVEKMEEESRRKLQEVREKGLHSSVTGDTKGKSLMAGDGLPVRKQPLTKTRSGPPVGQKMQLARTRSLAPSNLPGYDSPPSWQLPSQTQKTDIQGKAGHKMLFGSGLKVSISGGSDISGPKNKWGDRLLSNEVDSQSQTRGSQGGKHPPGLRARGFSPQQETDRSQITYSERQEKPRDHWSYSSSDCTISSDTDASSLLLDERSGGGHLALAKKLSDEGKTDAEPMQQISMLSGADSNTGCGLERRPLPISLTQGLPVIQNTTAGRSHKKLERQASLHGAEDPRFQAFAAKPAQHHNNYDPISCNYYYGLQGAGEMYHRHQAQIGFSNLQAGRQRLCRPSAMQEPGYAISSHHRPPVRGHVSVCRNASEPLSHYRQTFQEPQVHVLVRQNSSSDPQLNKWDDDSHVEHIEPTPWQEAGDRNNAWATPGGYNLFGTRETCLLPYSSVPDVRDTPRSHNLPMSDSLAPGSVPRGISPLHAGIVQSYNQECCSHSSTPCHSRQESPVHSMLTSSSRPTPTHMTDGQIIQNLSDPTPPSATPIEDSRASLYYHLCALFSKETVMSVMSQHPEETDAEKLCTYIIGMNI